MFEDKFQYKIGEIAKYLEVNPSLLRFWEKEFESFINASRNKRGVRLYSKEDFEMFKLIHSLVKIEGLTLKGAREKLSADKKGYKEKADVIRTLNEIKSFLLKLKENSY